LFFFVADPFALSRKSIPAFFHLGCVIWSEMLCNNLL